nr:ATP-binding protein [uncultured Holophaga sp.]
MRTSGPSPLHRLLAKAVFVHLFAPLLLLEILTILGLAWTSALSQIQHQSQLTRSLGQLVDNHLSQGERVMATLARVAESATDREMLLFLESTWNAQRSFETLYLLDDRDRVHLVMPWDGRFQGMDLSNLPGVKGTPGTGTCTLSPPYISVRTGEPVVLLIRDVPGRGKLVGELRLGLLQQEVQNIKGRSETDFIFITDQHGTLLSHPDIDRVRERRNLGSLPVLSPTREGRPLLYEYEGSRVLGAATRLEGTGWMVVDQVELARFSRTYLWTLLEILLVSLGVWGLLGWRLKRRLNREVTRPLEALSRMTAALADQTPHPEEEIRHAFQELDQLAQDFQTMVQRLQTRERDLQESEHRYRGLFDRMPVGLFRFDLQGRFVAVNPALVRILDYPDRAVLMATPVGLCLPLEPGMGLSDREFTLQRRDGQEIWVHLQGSFVEDPDSEGHGCFEGSLQDITQRKQAEALLRHSRDELENMVTLRTFQLSEANADLIRAKNAAEQANHSKSLFLANMSHELRTPLNAILLHAELLLEETREAGQSAMAEDLSRIQVAGRQLLGLIDDILDLSKIEAGKMTLFLETVDLPRLLEEVRSTAEPLVARNGNRFGLTLPSDPPVLRTDLKKIRQTLLNLLSNAAKFTERGSITLSVAPGPEGFLDFCVSDTGIGMDAQQLGRIFEEFGQADASTTRNYGGTGLGLTLSRRFAELLGGSLSATSQPGGGSTFTLRLPLETPPPPGT